MWGWQCVVGWHGGGYCDCGGRCGQLWLLCVFFFLGSFGLWSMQWFLVWLFMVFYGFFFGRCLEVEGKREEKEEREK